MHKISFLFFYLKSIILFFSFQPCKTRQKPRAKPTRLKFYKHGMKKYDVNSRISYKAMPSDQHFTSNMTKFEK